MAKQLVQPELVSSTHGLERLKTIIRDLRRGVMNDYTAWLDGACEPVNPGRTATSGAIIKDKEGTVPLEEGRLVGTGEGMSNNVAEYAAIIRVFEFPISSSPGHVIVHGDSNLVISQLSDKWAARKGLYYSTYLEARELLCRLRSLGWQVDLLWIPRTQNEECDALCRGAFVEAGVLREIHPSSMLTGFPAWAY
jgi:ribonuclease HI